MNSAFVPVFTETLLARGPRGGPSAVRPRPRACWPAVLIVGLRGGDGRPAAWIVRLVTPGFCRRQAGAHRHPDPPHVPLSVRRRDGGPLHGGAQRLRQLRRARPWRRRCSTSP
ncbi:MAG: hypothetical protein MZV70_08500 [Desulfobacterales bacterium]|nr:hypothetical protein [Desulfobacterales bacterium]